MGHVDFTDWARPDLVLELPARGLTYRVPAPSTDQGALIFAAALRGEVNLGYARDAEGNRVTEVPVEVQELLDTIGNSHPALTDAVYEQMVADGLDQWTIDKMEYYAVFYWARSREYADTLAKVLFTPREVAEAEAAAAPKG